MLITRIKGHVEHALKIFGDGDVLGRKLDFLAQEFLREANTIASKTQDDRISNLVIDMKADIEKVKEQIQNIQ